MNSHRCLFTTLMLAPSSALAEAPLHPEVMTGNQFPVIGLQESLRDTSAKWFTIQLT